MHVLQLVAQRLPFVVLIGGFGLLFVAEILLPATTPAIRVQRRIPRNLMVGGLYVVLGALIGSLLGLVSYWTYRHHLGLFHYLRLPLWGKIVLGVILIDLEEYWRHRISHVVPWIWKVHRLHHTDPFMDVTTTLRNHPLHWIVIVPRVCIIPLLGLTPTVLAIHSAIALAVQYFHHSNLHLPPAVEAVLGQIIVTPDRHFVHHGTQRKYNDTQYAITLILWDRLFGTMPAPADRQTWALGLDNFESPREQTFLGMALSPLEDDKRSRWYRFFTRQPAVVSADSMPG